MIRLAAPWALLVLPLVAAVGFWLWRRRAAGLRPRMQYSSLGLIGAAGRTLRARLLGLPAVLILAAAVLCGLALARPQTPWSEQRRTTEGIDIMLVVDVSESMRALDFEPNRLERAKAVVKEFVAGRTDDQVGLVIFGMDAFTLCPLTHDMQALAQFVDFIDFHILDGNRTAIGMGLANAVDRLRKSRTESKVVILLTDGENNAGRLDPLTAAQVAKQLGVRVYTIGVGTVAGWVPMPQRTMSGQMVIGRAQAALDVEELTRMAEMTGGRFFHAADGDKLEEIYRQIDRLERTKIEHTASRHYDEQGHLLILPALVLLLAALVLENTWLRTFP